MAVPKMSRHDMKQDDLVTAIEHARVYAQKNPTTLRNVAIALTAVAVVAYGVYWWISSRAAAGQALLNEGESRISAPILTPGEPPPGGLSYGSAAERDRAALESFTQLVSQYGGSKEGRIAIYYQGILLSRLGRLDEAEAALNRSLADPVSPMFASLARADLAHVKAQKGDLEAAAKIYTELAEDKQGGYPRDFALYYLAGILEQQGKRSDAAATYQKVATEFPNSPFISEAQRRAKL